MRALVIGYGSIGKRHASILSSLGLPVSIVTSQKIDQCPLYATVEDALNAQDVDYIVVANETFLHCDTLERILHMRFNGIILVEKPLFSRPENLMSIYNDIFVAYNLRFHKLLQYLKNILKDEQLLSFSVQVGSYLPDWRKDSDYRKCYSASREKGGGVLRDLSHELDYVLWICGKCLAVTAIGGHFSTLEIDSDDVYSILMYCERCPVVTVQLDYLSRVPMRKITIQTKKQNTILLNFIRGDLSVNGEVKYHVDCAIEETYVTQHKLMLKRNFSDFCDYQQGLDVVKLIDTIECAVGEKKWVSV